jgi:hypothetical protein
MCVCQCQPQSFIKNPAQLTLGLMGTIFPETYAEAFETGATWDANWMPGGPYIYSGNKRPDIREADEARFREWHEGFNAGLKLRLETNAHFAAWWDENKGRKVNGQYQRYIDPNCQEAVAA